MGKTYRFPVPTHPAETLDELVAKVHKLSKKSEKVFLDIPHNQIRMRERKVTSAQIFDVLRSGKGIDGPTLDKYGDWRIKLSRYTAGRTVQVVVVVKNDHIEVVTVI